jgi:hypothetical protein
VSVFFISDRQGKRFDEAGGGNSRDWLAITSSPEQTLCERQNHPNRRAGGKTDSTVERPPSQRSPASPFCRTSPKKGGPKLTCPEHPPSKGSDASNPERGQATSQGQYSLAKQVGNQTKLGTGSFFRPANSMPVPVLDGPRSGPSGPLDGTLVVDSLAKKRGRASYAGIRFLAARRWGPARKRMAGNGRWLGFVAPPLLVWLRFANFLGLVVGLLSGPPFSLTGHGEWDEGRDAASSGAMPWKSALRVHFESAISRSPPCEFEDDVSWLKPLLRR